MVNLYSIVECSEDGLLRLIPDIWVDQIAAEKEAYSLRQASMDETTGSVKEYDVVKLVDV